MVSQNCVDRKPRKEKSEGAGRVVELAVRRTPDLKMLAGRPCMAGRDTWVGTGWYGVLGWTGFYL